MIHTLTSFTHTWEFVAIIGATMLVHLLVTRDRKPRRPPLDLRRVSLYPIVGAATVVGILLLTADARDRLFASNATGNSNLLVTAGAFILWVLFIGAGEKLRPRLSKPSHRDRR